MPIQFRCIHCRQKLSVPRRKAGSEVARPACAKPIRVPDLDEAQALAARGAAAAPPAAEPPPAAPPSRKPASPAAAPRAAEAAVAAAPAAAPPAEKDLDEFESIDEQRRFVVSNEVGEEVEELWREESQEIDPWQADEEQQEPEFQLGRRGMGEVGMDMTPMVDVTFLLLIFFMITAAFDLQKSMQTTPPEPEQEGAAQTATLQDIEESSVEVEIDAEDRILVDGEPVASIGVLIDVLTKKIAEERMNEMLIRADYRATHGIVVSVTDAGMEANMQHIRRVTERGDD